MLNGRDPIFAPEDPLIDTPQAIQIMTDLVPPMANQEIVGFARLLGQIIGQQPPDFAQRLGEEFTPQPPQVVADPAGTMDFLPRLLGIHVDLQKKDCGHIYRKNIGRQTHPGHLENNQKPRG